MSSASTPLFALLADGRFPSGGHAHSGGYEAASRSFGLSDSPGLVSFLEGRLATVGRTEACLVAGILHRLGSPDSVEGRSRSDDAGEPDGAVDSSDIDWVDVDAEIEARIVSPALRAVSRSLGRQWVRAGRRIWPSPTLDALVAVCADGPHQVAAYAVVAATAGLPADDAVTVHLHHLIAGSATAAVRLHGLDPYEVQRCQVALAPAVAALTAEAVAGADRPLWELPATTGPVSDLLAEEHARWDMRLFQS
jgi:urease accessory protein